MHLYRTAVGKFLSITRFVIACGKLTITQDKGESSMEQGLEGVGSSSWG